MNCDRDVSTFGSEGEYYDYLAKCLRSEGARLTPGLVDRLGQNHPLSLALHKEAQQTRREYLLVLGCLLMSEKCCLWQILL